MTDSRQKSDVQKPPLSMRFKIAGKVPVLLQHSGFDLETASAASGLALRIGIASAISFEAWRCPIENRSPTGPWGYFHDGGRSSKGAVARFDDRDIVSIQLGPQWGFEISGDLHAS